MIPQMSEKPSGWARLFSKRKDMVEGDDFLTKLLDGLARIVEGADEAETLREIRAQVKEVFACDDISIFMVDPDDRPKPEEGEWVIKVRAGFGKGNRVAQSHAKAVPSLVPGKRLVASEFLTESAVLKAIALAFEEDEFYGCDIENKKVLLLKDPKPEDDLGSGDLSLLAFPLRIHNRFGRVIEKTRVGVLALYKVPIQRDLGAVEQPLRSLVAHAVMGAGCMLKDPVTTMFTEAFLREELGRQLNLFDLTRGKLQGGLVVGCIDTLHVYKAGLETQAAVDPAHVSQLVSSVVRGVGQCLWRRCEDHALGAGEDFKCGYPGRIGHDGFGAILPRLAPSELCLWAQKVQKDVKNRPFEGEEHLPAGDVTVSLRVIPFGTKGGHTAKDLWKLATGALDELEKEQHKAKAGGAGFATSVNTVLVTTPEGQWVTPSELTKAAHEALGAPKEEVAAPMEVDGIGLVDDVRKTTKRVSAGAAPKGAPKGGRGAPKGKASKR